MSVYFLLFIRNRRYYTIMPTGLPCHREPSIVLMSMIEAKILSMIYPQNNAIKISSLRYACVKAFSKSNDVNRDSRISKPEFIRIFIRTLSSKYLCGRPTRPPITIGPVRSCGVKQLKRTKKIIIKGFTSLFCAYKKKYPLLSAETFVNKYYKKYSRGKDIKIEALYKTVSKKLPKKLKLLRLRLRTLK